MTKKETITETDLEAQEAVRLPLLKDRMFYLLAATMLVYVIFESIIAFWISVYFEKGLSSPAHTAALRISVFWFGLIANSFSASTSSFFC